jgi:integrase
MEVLNFLTKLFQGRNPSTVNTYRSAISTIAGLMGGRKEIGSSPLIARCIQGMWELKPQKAKYESFWDPEIILEKVKSWGPNEDLSLEKLTDKLIILLKLAIFGRTADLNGIRRSSLVFRENEMSLKIFGSKENRSRQTPSSTPIYVADFEDPIICPVRCMRNYLDRTAEITFEDFLFVSLVGGKGHLSKKDIDRRVLRTMRESGINTSIFKSHSVRGAAATKALENGTPLEDVLLTGRWKSISVFKKFYHRSRIPISMGRLLSTN